MIGRTLSALKFLFIGPFIVALCAVINVMVSPGEWWVQWVALGVGIAWVISLFRVIMATIAVGGIVALIALIRKG